MAAQQGSPLEADADFMNLYSRQIGAYGLDAMAKLVKLRVLVVGLKGVGVEVAKNLILAGPGTLTLADDAPCAIEDLGANFFLAPVDVGQPRAAVVAPKLQPLNKMVRLARHAGRLSEAVVAAHSVVVFTDSGDRAELLRWNAFCRGAGVAFIAAAVRGPACFAFSDFGARFTVRDATGEAPATRVVKDVTFRRRGGGPGGGAGGGGEEGEAGLGEAEALVTLLGMDDHGAMHGLPESEHDGWVTFDGVQGCDDGGAAAGRGGALCALGPWRVRHATRKEARTRAGAGEGGADAKRVDVDVFDGYSFRIWPKDAAAAAALAAGAAGALTPYRGGGTAKQHKEPELRAHRSLAACLAQPVAPDEAGLMFTDGAKFGRAEQLHVGWVALMAFAEAHAGRLPRVGDAAEAEAVVRLAVAHNDAMRAAAAATVDGSGGGGGGGGGGGFEAPMVLDAVEEPVVRTLALHAAAEFQPLCAFLGGVVAQEVVKLTGKFSPLNQWLHLDCFEVLPGIQGDAAAADAAAAASEPPPLTVAQRAPRGSRYDHLISLFGDEFVTRTLGGVRTFMVGCGALGCEFLKNFALLGVACGEGGLVTVTDNDRIEVSNLNRQFLFREHNVKEFKSAAAVRAVAAMNPALRTRALQQLVSPESEGTFGDAFWRGQDVVTNALDNVKARLYVDRRCVFFGLPLLESGTLGVKCNVQVVVPHMTESYGDGPEDAADDSIPMCTLRNFPSLVEHCIEWSRGLFEDTFAVPPAVARQYVEDRLGFLAAVAAKTLAHPNRAQGRSAVPLELTTLRALRRTVLHEGASPALARGGADEGFARCVADAHALFHGCFRDNILELQHQFPEDKANEETGERFWSGAKRFPRAAKFDVRDDTHISFLASAANLFAVAHGIAPPPELAPCAAGSPWRSPARLAAMVRALPPARAWRPSGAPIAATDAERKKQEEEHEARAKKAAAAAAASAGAEEDAEAEELRSLLAELAAADVRGLCFQPAEFEKDCDANFHIDFIAAAANLRAANYRIAEAPRHSVKMIAGKIIPAIATTTAAVCGLVTVELLKLLQRKPLGAFKNSSNSLGLNMYMMQEPGEPLRAQAEYDPIEMAEVKTHPPGFTKWDKLEVRAPGGGAFTMAQFLAAFEAQTKLRITLLYHAASTVYDAAKPAERLAYKAVSGMMLYDTNAWKPALAALYASRADTDLAAWVRERYEVQEGVEVVPPLRSYIELEASCEDKQGTPYKIPTLIYHFGSS